MYRIIAVLTAALLALTACAQASRTLEEANNNANQAYLEQLAEDSDSIEIDEEGNAVYSDLEGEELDSAMASVCENYKLALDPPATDPNDWGAATDYDYMAWANQAASGTPVEEQIRDMFDNFNSTQDLNGDGRTLFEELTDEFDSEGWCN